MMKTARNPERDLRGARCGASYELVELVGVGSVAEVWLARSTELARSAAVKVLHRATLAKPESLAALGADVHRACALTRRAVEVWDAGDLEDGRRYLMMEFCAGGSLASLLASTGRLSPEQTLMVVAGPASALAATHDAGLAHHDIKPDNILFVDKPLFVDVQGHMLAAKLGDFGTAKLRSSLAPRHSSFDWMGTPGFMAPEQVEPAGVTSLQRVDHRADIFSLGCVLYLCLTGRLPYPAHGADEYIHAVKLSPRPIPTTRELQSEIPRELDEVVLSCIALDRNQRINSMGELMRRFAGAIADGGIPGPTLLAMVAPRFVTR
jgi:serine/threonine-protein kinase